MKNKIIKFRADDELIRKLDFTVKNIKVIGGKLTRSELIRVLIEEQYHRTKENYIKKQKAKEGLIGKLQGYHFRGKTYNASGNEVESEAHDEDCFCCRKNLLKQKKHG